LPFTKPETAPVVATLAGARQLPKYLRVVVQDPGKEGGGGDHVNIRVPLQLIRAGMKLGAVLPPEAMVKVGEALEDKGIKLDLRNLTPDTLDELIEALGDLTLEVTGDHGEGFGEHGVKFHGDHLYAAQTKVPMIIVVPGLPGRAPDAAEAGGERPDRALRPQLEGQARRWRALAEGPCEPLPRGRR
jgi:hypothetical protein